MRLAYCILKNCNVHKSDTAVYLKKTENCYNPIDANR